jgi:hypothetical protein
VIDIQTDLLLPEDFFLFGIESLIVVGLVVALIIAVMVQLRYSKTTSIGWGFIFMGLLFLTIHAVFDVLDTLQWEDTMVDLLNVFDGVTFVIGMLLFAVGIYKIAEYGAKQWVV